MPRYSSPACSPRSPRPSTGSSASHLTPATSPSEYVWFSWDAVTCTRRGPSVGLSSCRLAFSDDRFRFRGHVFAVAASSASSALVLLVCITAVRYATYALVWFIFATRRIRERSPRDHRRVTYPRAFRNGSSASFQPSARSRGRFIARRSNASATRATGPRGAALGTTRRLTRTTPLSPSQPGSALQEAAALLVPRESVGLV